MMVMQGEINDGIEFDIYQHFMTKDNVYFSRNPLLFPKGEIEIINFPLNADFRHLKWIDQASDIISVSLIVFSDWSNLKGREIVQESLNAVEKLSNSRAAFVDTSLSGCGDFFEFEKLDVSDHASRRLFVEDIKECSMIDISNTEILLRNRSIQEIKSWSLFQPGETGFVVNGRVRYS
jgi:hypothetical protein